MNTETNEWKKLLPNAHSLNSSRQRFWCAMLLSLEIWFSWKRVSKFSVLLLTYLLFLPFHFRYRKLSQPLKNRSFYDIGNPRSAYVGRITDFRGLMFHQTKFWRLRICYSLSAQNARIWQITIGTYVTKHAI